MNVELSYISSYTIAIKIYKNYFEEYKDYISTPENMTIKDIAEIIHNEINESLKNFNNTTEVI